MDPALKAALDRPDIEQVLARAVAHADFRIRRYIWRGFRPTTSAKKNCVCAGDRSADDFVAEALGKLLEGVRAYDPSRDLLENLNSATDSLIWSYKNTSDRSPVADYAISKGEDGRPIDPITTSKEVGPGTDDSLIFEEIRADQSRAYDNLRASFDGNRDMQAYLDAMREGFFNPRDIADVTHLTAEQVSELRRSAKNHAKLLFGVQNFTELKRKIEQGS